MLYNTSLSQSFVPPTPPPVYTLHPTPQTTHLFSIPVSLLLFCYITSCIFQIPHVSDIMQYLSLSDLFHLAEYPLGPSMLLQMAEFHSFLWLSSIPLYISTMFSLSIHLLMDT